jgi:branched-chain amino acid transport system substrate-binding protein
MKRFSLCSVLIAAVLFLTITTSQAAEEIRIGFISSLTGPAAYDGKILTSGATVAVNQINAAGGVLGRTLKLLTEDQKGVPAEGVNAAVKLTDRDKVHALIQQGNSSICLAIGEHVRKMDNPVPLLTGLCTAPKLTKVGNSWFFRSCQNSLMEGPSFVKHWVQNLKVKKVSFLAANDDWGRSSVETYSEELKKLGGEVVSVDYFRSGDFDFAPYLTKIKAKKPDAVDIIARAEVGARISLAFVELGMDKMMIQLGSDGQVSDDFIKLGGKAVEGLWVMSRYEPTLPGPRNEQFIKEYMPLMNQLPDQKSQAGYDDIYIIADAIKRAGGTDPNKIREALQKTDYQGLASRIAFDKNHQAHPDLLISQIRGGKRQVMTRVSTVEIDSGK